MGKYWKRTPCGQLVKVPVEIAEVDGGEGERWGMLGVEAWVSHLPDVLVPLAVCDLHLDALVHLARRHDHARQLARGYRYSGSHSVCVWSECVVGEMWKGRATPPKRCQEQLRPARGGLRMDPCPRISSGRAWTVPIEGLCCCGVVSYLLRRRMLSRRCSRYFFECSASNLHGLLVKPRPKATTPK